jgi:hypothetical protein
MRSIPAPSFVAGCAIFMACAVALGLLGAPEWACMPFVVGGGVLLARRLRF